MNLHKKIRRLTLNPLDLRRPRAFSNLRPLERTYGFTDSCVCKLLTLQKSNSPTVQYQGNRKCNRCLGERTEEEESLHRCWEPQVICLSVQGYAISHTICNQTSTLMGTPFFTSDARGATCGYPCALRMTLK